MTYDDWEGQRRVAELRLTCIEGDAFEHEVQSILKMLWQEDFTKTIPMGSRGDLKCDGFRRSTGTVYQCYGPRYGQVNVNEALSKINTDFRGAIDLWGDQIKEWKLVVNVYADRIPSEIVREIARLSKDLRVKAAPVDRTDLLNIIKGLTNADRVELYGSAHSPMQLHYVTHDRKLYDQLRGLLGSSGVIRFLDEQDMGYGHEVGRIKGLWQFVDEWRGPDFRFIDDQLEGIRLQTIDVAGKYQIVHAENMSLVEGRYTMNVSPGIGPEFNDAEHRRLTQVKALMHGMASQIVSLYNELIHMGKLRLPPS